VIPHTGTAAAGMHHFSVARGATIVAVTFMGPYTITYVNGYEAPRRDKVGPHGDLLAEFPYLGPPHNAH
jgi:hypothetical protein